MPRARRDESEIDQRASCALSGWWRHRNMAWLRFLYAGILLVLVPSRLVVVVVTAFVVVEHPTTVGPASRHSGLAETVFNVSHARRRANYLSKCYLFVRPANIEKALSNTWKVPRSINLSDLASNDLPWRLELEQNAGNKASGAAPTLTIRTLQMADVETISEMCVQEYSTGRATFPLDNILLIGDWIDRHGLRILVDVTSRIKVDVSPKDHAILVACINETIVGMVEVSRQPVIPDRNPEPFPMPLVVKRAYAAAVTGSALQGWITNLLIVPEHRGGGYSKVMVAACERVASSWECTSMHLHCDADENDGRISQALYRGLGYQTLRETADAFSWMNGALPASVFAVQGVPLLYLRKDLRKATIATP